MWPPFITNTIVLGTRERRNRIPIESNKNIHLCSKELDSYRNRILELIVQTYGKLRIGSTRIAYYLL